MDVDEQIRHVLHGSLVPVESIAAARQQIARRASKVRRQRRWLRASAISAATAVVIVVVATVLWAAQPAGDGLPVIAPTPAGTPTPSPIPDGTTSTACESLRIADQLDGFLDAWTTSPASSLDGACVLPGRHGPAPLFDTGDLGPEQELMPGDLPAGYEVERWSGPRERVPGYPLVHLGRVQGTDRQLFLEWRLDRLRAPVACLEGSCWDDELPNQPGIGGIGRGGGLLMIDVWVPDEASVVALSMDGQPVLWQRPVARVSRLVMDDYRPSPNTTAHIEVFNSAGEQIASFESPIDF